MRDLWGRLVELPAVARRSLLGAVSLVLAALVGSGVWTWTERREAASQRTLAPVVLAANRALGSGDATALDEAARQLNEFLKGSPRSRAAVQAWYLLGDVELRRRRWDAASAAFTEAAGRDAGTLGVLSRLGQGYVLEGKGDMARAVETYQAALARMGPKDFLYGELLLAKARAQEQARDSAGAVATYRQYLKDFPTSERADEVRIRLGLLGAAG